MLFRSETAAILRHATPRSLVLLDEIGRGTSTYDGLSLAWSVVEALHEDSAIAARTLFATHYHELTRLAERLPRLRNAQVTVREANGEVIFLRKVVDGACDSSYGIQVAKMAGVPDRVIRRAWEILSELERGDSAPLGSKSSGRKAAKSPESQVDLFGVSTANGHAAVPVENPVHRELFDAVMGLDVNASTPLEILFKVAEAQRKAKQGKS